MESTYKTTFNDEELSVALNKFSGQAEDILNDESKFRTFVNRVNKWLSKGHKIPVLKGIIKDLQSMLELIVDFKEGVYRKIPLRIMIIMTAAILYVISPIDLIPDPLPIIGYVDDLAIISLAMKLGVKSELHKYNKWKKNYNIEQFLLSHFICHLSQSEFVAAFFTDEDHNMELLYTKDERVPFYCHILKCKIPESFGSTDDIISSFNKALPGLKLRWSSLGPIPISLEKEFPQFEENFIIIGDDY